MPDHSVRVTLQDRVYAGISSDIAHGVLPPGERLRVAHLAMRFGTSQAPVREALRRLTEEGLADTVPYVGTVVRAPSWEQIQEIYALRAELEAYAIRRTLAHPPAGMASIARRALRELKRALRSGDEIAVLEADLDFHRTICLLSGSTLTVDLWESLIRQFRGVRLSLMRSHPDHMDTVFATHEELVKALESGDARRAEDAFRGHLADALATFADRTGSSVDHRLFLD